MFLKFISDFFRQVQDSNQRVQQETVFGCKAPLSAAPRFQRIVCLRIRENIAHKWPDQMTKQFNHLFSYRFSGLLDQSHRTRFVWRYVF